MANRAHLHWRRLKLVAGLVGVGFLLWSIYDTARSGRRLDFPWGSRIPAP